MGKAIAAKHRGGTMLDKLYEKLWRRIGGKPWTEIIRDDAPGASVIL